MTHPGCENWNWNNISVLVHTILWTFRELNFDWMRDPTLCFVFCWFYVMLKKYLASKYYFRNIPIREGISKGNLFTAGIPCATLDKTINLELLLWTFQNQKRTCRALKGTTSLPLGNATMAVLIRARVIVHCVLCCSTSWLPEIQNPIVVPKVGAVRKIEFFTAENWDLLMAWSIFLLIILLYRSSKALWYIMKRISELLSFA